MLRESFVLSNGIQIPKIGLGTYQMSGVQCKEAVTAALNAGYRHIDTAIYYSNHKNVAEAIRDYSREELFITSKIPPYKQGYENAMKATLDSLKELNTDYLDLMLIHWPGVAGFDPNDPNQVNERHSTWRALEDLYNQGKLKAIGVSNFLQLHLSKLFEVCRIKPMVNQFEYHPWCHDDELVGFCNSNGIIVEAYSSLARAQPNLWSNPEFTRLASKYNKEKGQVLLRWGLQKGCVILPKSGKADRIASNIQLDFEISLEDMNLLDSFNSNTHTCWDPRNIKI